MALALTPNVRRICAQLNVARRMQGQSQAVAAAAATLSIKGLNSLYAGRGSPTLAELDALAHLHGLGPITTIVRPNCMDERLKHGANAMQLIHTLNAEQAMRGQIKQRTIRAESRFIFARLGLGHRILSDRDVYDAAHSANVSAVAMDVKAMVLHQGGLRLRSTVLTYAGGTMDLDEAVPLPVLTPPTDVGARLHQGRARDEMDELDAMLAEGQTNATANVVPAPELYDGDDQQELTPELEAQLFGNLTPPTN